MSLTRKVETALADSADAPNTSDEVRQLERMGYWQELLRRMSGCSQRSDAPTQVWSQPVGFARWQPGSNRLILTAPSPAQRYAL